METEVRESDKMKLQNFFEETVCLCRRQSSLWYDCVCNTAYNNICGKKI